jgi:hypothetical protein
MPRSAFTSSLRACVYVPWRVDASRQRDSDTSTACWLPPSADAIKDARAKGARREQAASGIRQIVLSEGATYASCPIRAIARILRMSRRQGVETAIELWKYVRVGLPRSRHTYNASLNWYKTGSHIKRLKNGWLTDKRGSHCLLIHLLKAMCIPPHQSMPCYHVPLRMRLGASLSQK